LFAASALLWLAASPLLAQWDRDDLVVFRLARETVEQVTLGSEEPEQKLTIVSVRLTQQGLKVLAQLTAANIGKGLLIEMPDGRQFGPNRIEKALAGAKLAMVLPSDVAQALHATLGGGSP
jgi:hypothetical protein